MAEDNRKWVLVKLEPIMIEMAGGTKIYTSKDYNPYEYQLWKRLIEKHNFQIGDDLKVCLFNAINNITPVRPEQTEEQKQIKERGIFGI